MAKKNENPLMAPAKAKKHHLWGLWVPLITIFSLILIPTGMAFLLFYDPSHLDTGIEKEADQKQIFSSVMTDMFDNCRKEEDPTIDVVITQYQLNQLLYNASANVTQAKNPDSPIKQFAIVIKNDRQYKFDLEISSFNILKTHVTIETTVADGAALPDGSKGFLFRIDNMRIGRLNDLQSVLPWLMNATHMNFDSIFESAGLSIKFDFNNLQMTYSYDDFIDNFSEMSGNTNKLFSTIFTNFFTKDKVDFVHTENNNTHGTIQMAPYTDNEKYNNERFRINPMFGDDSNIPMLTFFASVAEKLKDDGVISEENATTQTLAIIKFLSYGNEYLDSGENEFINNIYDDYLKATYCENLEVDAYSSARKLAVFDNTSAGLMDKINEAVNSVINDPEFNREDFLDRAKTSEAYLFGDTGEDDPYIVYDEDVRTMLKANNKLIGYGFGFVGARENNKTKMSYSILDNVYPTIVPGEGGENDKMALTFGLNVNGTETLLVMPMEGEEVHDGGVHGLSFDLKNADLYYGNEVFENLKEQLQKDVINNVGETTDDDNMIHFVKSEETGDVEKIQMVFDFDEHFDNKRTTDPTDPFLVLNDEAEANNTKLFLEFEFSKTEVDSPEPNNHYGQFNVSIGYRKVS